MVKRLVGAALLLLALRPLLAIEKEALTEYNGGPAGRHPAYYRMVMGTYVEILERTDLKCRYQPAPKRPPVMALLARV